jgi:hypothetical protein
VCTTAGGCAEDLTLGLPAAVAVANGTTAAAAATFQAQYSHDFDGASYKVTAMTHEGGACGMLAVYPAAAAAAAGLAADHTVAAALTAALQAAAANTTAMVGRGGAAPQL